MLILNRGSKVIEGEVDSLLKSNVLKVTIEVDDVEKTKSILQTTSWHNKIEKIKGNEISFNLDQGENPVLNKYLVEQGINVNAIVPVRSLEDYFLSITAEAK
jgi:ABC-type multidrug transport system ATPase subunit